MWIADSPEPASKFLPVVFERTGTGVLTAVFIFRTLSYTFTYSFADALQEKSLAMPFFINFCQDVWSRKACSAALMAANSASPV